MPIPTIVIKNAAGETKSEMSVLKGYFGLKDGQTLSQFLDECKAVGVEGKRELVLGAARELEYTVTEVGQ